jgi:hypothetical protein
MAKTRAFGGITESIWQCVKSTSEREHGTKYDPADGNQGTSTTDTFVGKVILSYDFEPSKETITYVINQKPFIVTDDQIWNGLQETIDHCKR